MTRPMMRGASLAWLVVVLIAGSYLAWRVETGLTFRTDLMALLPMDEQDAAMQGAQETVTQALSRQIVLLAGHADRDTARAAAQTLGDALVRSGLVKLTDTGIDAD